MYGIYNVTPCGTGRKWLRGPRGTGFLFARKEALPSSGDDVLPKDHKRSRLSVADASLVGEPPTLDHEGAVWKAPYEYDLNSGAHRYEMWEASEAMRAGLAEAVDVCNTIGPDRISEISRGLAHRLRKGLASVSGVTLRGGSELFGEAAAADLCAIVLFDTAKVGVESATIKYALAEYSIAVSVAPSFHSFDPSERALPPVLRMSPTYFNTEDEVDRAVQAVRTVLEKLSTKA